MCDIVRGRGYYVWRIIPEEEECEVGDRGRGVDMTGRVCYGKCDEGNRGKVLHVND